MSETSEGTSIGKPIKSDLAPFGPEVEFSTFEEAKDWSTSQNTTTENVLRSSRVPNIIKETIKRPPGEIADIATMAIDEEKLSVNKRQQFRKEIQSRLNQIKEGDTFVFSGPLSQPIRLALGQVGAHATGVVSGVIGFPLADVFQPYGNNVGERNQATIGYCTGAILAGRFEANYAHLKQRILDLISNSETNLGKLITEIEAAANVAATAREEEIAARNARGQEHNALVESHKAEMDGIRKTFADELALKEPATYWSGKRTNHGIAATLGIVAFAVVAYTGVDFLWSKLPSMLAELPAFTATTSNPSEGASSNSFLSSLPRLALVTIPAIVFFWVLKIFARIFVENFHSMQDASQRSTMLVTYLSMLKNKENPVTQDERLLILHALFRPRSEPSGDDAPPPNLLEIIKGKSPG